MDKPLHSGVIRGSALMLKIDYFITPQQQKTLCDSFAAAFLYPVKLSGQQKKIN